jgi:hypothetical protein
VPERILINTTQPTGLGVDYVIDCSSGSTTGKTIDCDSWRNFFTLTCWGLCQAGSISTGQGTQASPDLSSGQSTDTPPLVSPSPLCAVLSCDDNGNVTLGSGTIFWVIGAGLAVVALGYLMGRR